MTIKTITFNDADWQVVPKDLIKSCENLLAVKGRHHTELAYKQLCQSFVSLLAAPSPPEEFCEWKRIDKHHAESACEMVIRHRYCPDCGKPIKEVTE